MLGQKIQGRWWQIGGAIILLLLMVVCYAWVWSLCLRVTDGRFIYGLDDPYIHLSIARNFALHGVWGVTPYAPSAASSSPLWIFLLASTIRLFGDWVMWPFVFGIATSAAATLYVYLRFLRQGISVPFAVLAAAGVFAVAPFHFLPFIGMEHSLQVLLDLIFGFWIFDLATRSSDWRDFQKTLVLTTLMCACRYESVFLLIVPFFWFAWKREWRVVLGLGIGPIIAVGGFGLFAHLLGMAWVPNSIVLKGNVSQPFTPPWFLNFYLNLHGRAFALSDLGVVCFVAGLVLRVKAFRGRAVGLQLLLWTFLVTDLLHSALASIGIVYRYEAYLLALGMVVAVLGLKEFIDVPGSWGDVKATKLQVILAIVGTFGVLYIITPVIWVYQFNANLIVTFYAVALITYFGTDFGDRTRRRVVQMLLTSTVPLALYFLARGRAMQALHDTPMASRDIYTQQIQMARFVNRYYSGGRVVVNDIGAVSYFDKIHLFDLWGLATDSVRDLKRTNTWTTKTMDVQLRKFNPDIVMCYQDWYRGWRAMPSWLIPVATWTIPPVTSAGRQVVVFYAPSADAAAKMKAQITEFEPTVPKSVALEFIKPALSKTQALINDVSRKQGFAPR